MKLSFHEIKFIFNFKKCELVDLHPLMNTIFHVESKKRFVHLCVCVCACACQGCVPQRFGSGLTFPALTSCLSSSPLPVDGRKPWRDTPAPATQTCLFRQHQWIALQYISHGHTHTNAHIHTFFSPYSSFLMWNDTVTVKCRLSALICGYLRIHSMNSLRTKAFFPTSVCLLNI